MVGIEERVRLKPHFRGGCGVMWVFVSVEYRKANWAIVRHGRTYGIIHLPIKYDNLTHFLRFASKFNIIAITQQGEAMKLDNYTRLGYN
jgi:hypothetical protein